MINVNIDECKRCMFILAQLVMPFQNSYIQTLPLSSVNLISST